MYANFARVRVNTALWTKCLTMHARNEQHRPAFNNIGQVITTYRGVLEINNVSSDEKGGLMGLQLWGRGMYGPPIATHHPTVHQG